MKINLIIKQGDYNPTIVTKNTLSQVEYKKKNMLYQPPEPDRQKKSNSISKNKNTTKPPLKSKEEPKLSKQIQKKLIKNLDDISKNQASLDMIHNSNNILQRQNQILAQNQKAIGQMTQKMPENNQSEGQIRKMLKEGLDKIGKQVQQVKKIRDDITRQLKQANKNIKQMKNNKQQGSSLPPKDPNQLLTMNQNLRNLTENVQNDIQSLKNMEAIKQLQNFNIGAYEQSINSLKRQLIAYQKQSEAIEKQLRIRTAKLEKLNLPQNLENQLLQPYTKYLTNKANAIDLHSIREKVYEKLGTFDYAKFENDVEMLMNQAKNQLSDFDIICKEYRIDVPTLKFDQKELKNLQFKAPSVLDQYKARKGIKFQEITKQTKQNIGKFTMNQRQTFNYNDTSGTTGNKKQKTSKQRQKIKQMITKPINLANQIPYTRKDIKQPQTVLETTNERDKANLKKRLKAENKQDQNFNKYLENRARQQLEHIYKQKKQQLKKMQQQLYETANEPIQINMQRYQNIIKKPPKPQETQKKKQDKKQEYEDESFENQIQESIDKKKKKKEEESPIKKQQEKSMREIGKEALKQKLQKLLKKQSKGNNIIPSPNLIQYPQNQQRPPSQNYQNMGNIAEGIVSLINNTLTQVNNNLSNNIEKRIQSRSRDENRREQSKSPKPKTYNIPHLQQFRPPPTFNMNVNFPTQQSQPQVVYQIQPPYPANQRQPQAPIKKNSSQKMIKKDYDHYRVKEESQLQVSQLSSDSDN